MNYGQNGLPSGLMPKGENAVTFGKRDDGCWHWEYTGPYAKGYGKKLWLVWLFVMVLLYACFGIIAIVEGTSQLIMGILLTIALALSLLVTLIFASIWLFTCRKKGCVYTANDRVFSPTNSLYSGRYTKLYFDDVKSLTQCRQRDAIILKAGALPMEVYADSDDFASVWSFLRDRCRNASIEEESV